MVDRENRNVIVGRRVGEASRTQARPSFATKRVIDTLGAGFLLVVLSPLFALVALAVKLTSPGPAFFIQERVGAKRRVSDGVVEWERGVFAAYKFRSMYDGADEGSHRRYIRSFVSGQAAERDEGPGFKLTSDPRVTPVGSIIRRTSIDELPQLMNVLKGEMSLVGPRPVPTYEIEGYDNWHFERFDALPGITGYWQVYGRGRVPFDEMMRMDIHYVRNRTLWLDLKLLALTLPAVVTGKGAQ